MEMIIDFPGGARVDAHFGPFIVHTDQPIDSGGEDSAPSPFATFLAALATCAGYYVLEFCRKRGISVEGLRLVQKTERDAATKLISKVSLEIQLPADFPGKYATAVIRAAEQCTVKKHFERPPTIDIRTAIAETVRA